MGRIPVRWGDSFDVVSKMSLNFVADIQHLLKLTWPVLSRNTSLSYLSGSLVAWLAMLISEQQPELSAGKGYSGDLLSPICLD